MRIKSESTMKRRKHMKAAQLKTRNFMPSMSSMVKFLKPIALPLPRVLI
jgi:hypothetical protein